MSLWSLYVCVHCICITVLLLQFNPFKGGKEGEGEKQVEESEDDENERKKVRGNDNVWEQMNPLYSCCLCCHGNQKHDKAPGAREGMYEWERYSN